MEFRQAEHFLAVVEHGGVSKAADVLNLAQPTLSQSIKSLERELGAQLFHRVGRGLVLTVAGEALVKVARQLLRDVQTAQAAVAYAAGITSGQLDIAAIGLPFERLPPAIGEFLRLFPDVRLRLETPTVEAELMRHIMQGRSEVGFTPLGAGDLVSLQSRFSRDLEITPLGLGELVCVLPPDTDPDLPDPLPLTQLPPLATTAVPVGSHARAAVENALRDAFVSTRAAVVTAHRYTQLPLVMRGVGMAFVYREQGEWARGQGAVVRGLDPAITLPFGMVKRPGQLSPPARHFVDIALKYVRGGGFS